MMKTSKALFTLAVAAGLLGAAGCNQQQFGLAAQSQEFGQKAMYNTQVDVLWVIDTSSSMDTHQNLLADQMGLFVDAMNVIGSRPDGWWKDRAGAMRRLVDEQQALKGD